MTQSRKTLTGLTFTRFDRQYSQVETNRHPQTRPSTSHAHKRTAHDNATGQSEKKTGIKGEHPLSACLRVSTFSQNETQHALRALVSMVGSVKQRLCWCTHGATCGNDRVPHTNIYPNSHLRLRGYNVSYGSRGSVRQQGKVHVYTYRDRADTKEPGQNWMRKAPEHSTRAGSLSSLPRTNETEQQKTVG